MGNTAIDRYFPMCASVVLQPCLGLHAASDYYRFCWVKDGFRGFLVFPLYSTAVSALVESGTGASRRSLV